MVRKLPRGVSHDRDRHGNVRLYFRMPGRKKVRLRETPGTKAFEEEVACARLGLSYGATPAEEDRRRPPAEESFDALVLSYCASITLAPVILNRRRRMLEEICESRTKKGRRRGSLPYALMERGHVLEIRDELRATPGARNEVVKVLSAMFGWAIERGRLKANPALGIRKIYSGDGFHTWSRDEVARFEARHPAGSTARLALHLGLYTGLRLSDLAILGRQHLREGWITIRPGKTTRSSGVLVEIPVLDVLQRTIDASPCGDLTFLTTRFGRPFTVNGLGNKMREWCDQAGLPDCTMHGLRKAGATIAAENGATDEQLMAIFGWTTKSQSTHYTKRANRRRMAEAGMAKLAPERSMDENCPTAPAVEKSGTKKA